jgi:hypothetical protein
MGAVELQAPSAAPAPPDLQPASDSGSSNTDNITNDNTPTFDITLADSGATVTLLRNGVSTGVTRVGNGPMTDTTAPADNTYTYTVTQTNTDGAVSAPSAGLAVTIDTTAAAPSAPDLNAASDSGASNTDNITNATSRTFDLSGVEAGATVTLLRNGVSVGSRIGNGAITDSTAAADGTLTYTATQTDVAGNISPASTALSVTLDTTAAPPVVDLNAASDSGASNTDNVTNATSRTIDLTGVEAGATVTLLRNGTMVGTRTGNGSIVDSAPVADGTLMYTATQTDLAGNISAPSAALAVTLKTAAPPQPSAPILTNGTSIDTTDSPTPSFTTNVAGNTVVLLRNGTPVASSPSGGAITDPGPLAPGTYSYTVQAVDVAGNTSAPSAGTSVVVIPPGSAPGPIIPSRNSTGYWLVATDGGVFSFGGAQFFGSTGGIKLNKPIVGMAATPSHQGYWMVATDGGVFAFGDAGFFGSTGSIKLVKPILAMAPTPTGKGYWLLASDGGLFAFGDARFFGSATNVAAHNPAVAMASTPSGGGYIIVLADGTVVAFGDAQNKGGLNGKKLVSPIVGASMTSSGDGYWLYSADGGVFAFGDAAFNGSIGGIKLAKPVVSGVAQPDGKGYWMAATDGGVFAFGSATFQGSAATIRGHQAIVGMERA